MSRGLNTNFVSTEEEVGRYFVDFLHGFLDQYPQYDRHPIYLAGESYAGKYIPSIAHEVKNRQSERTLDLRGLLIGNGWSSPRLQSTMYADQLYWNGLLDVDQYDQMRHVQLLCQSKLLQGFHDFKTLALCDTPRALLAKAAGDVKPTQLITSNY